MTETPTARPRGFAALSAEARRAIAKLGGHAVPREKRAFAANKELAKRAGKTGGQTPRVKP